MIMLSTLMQINTLQEEIICKQAKAIDELFILLCQHGNLEGVEPLLNDIQDIADKTKKL